MQAPVPSPEETLVLREQLPLSGPYVAPRTPTEETLAGIWREVLSMDRVGVEDAYRDLGGDSFLASVIFALIDEAFEVPVPMAILMRAPTVAKLAAEIDRRLELATGTVGEE